MGSAEAWSLLSEMIEQVAKVHAEFGMNYFHMGADEVFQIGVCQETMKVMEREGNHNRLLLWHLVRVAAFVKNKYPVYFAFMVNLFLYSIFVLGDGAGLARHVGARL